MTPEMTVGTSAHCKGLFGGSATPAPASSTHLSQCLEPQKQDGGEVTVALSRPGQQVSWVPIQPWLRAEGEQPSSTRPCVVSIGQRLQECQPCPWVWV